MKRFPNRSNAKSPTGRLSTIGRWNHEDARCAIRREFPELRWINRVIYCCEKIARAIKGEAEALARHRAERALHPAGSKFVDCGGLIRVVLIAEQ